MIVHLVSRYAYSEDDYERESTVVERVFSSQEKALEYIHSKPHPDGRLVEPYLAVRYRPGEFDDTDNFVVIYSIQPYEVE